MVNKLPPSTTLRQRLRGPGPPALGVFVKLPGLEVIDCLCGAGVDFAVVDLEHSVLDERSASDQLAYARALGLPALVRLPEVDAPMITRLLEVGAAGVQIADVRRRGEVEALVRAVRFAPDGDRGVSVSHRAAGYGAIPIPDYVAGVTGAPLLVIQVEAAPGDPLEELLAAPIDVAFVGTVDLSVRLGVAGEVDHPTVRAAVSRVAAAARAGGVAYGEHVTSGTTVASARYVTIGADTTALQRALAGLVLAGRARFGPEQMMRADER